MKCAFRVAKGCKLLAPLDAEYLVDTTEGAVGAPACRACAEGLDDMKRAIKTFRIPRTS